MLAPTPLEIASNLSFGELDDAPALPELEEPLSPLAALEDAVRPALLRPPCLVSFSGGRDSSSVLAAATACARREGLPLPVPATLVFPSSTGADESAWQELMVRHLGLEEWIRVEIADQLDFVGPVATRVLRRHGFLWPMNAHLHVPLLERAGGGSLATGVDGDGLFGQWQWARLGALRARRARPRPRDLPRLAYAHSPRPLRRAWTGRRVPLPLPWLRPEAQRAVRAAWLAELVSQPRRWDRYVAWYGRRRTLGLLFASLELLGGDSDTLVVHPLNDRRFLAALARHGGRDGYGDRTAVMRTLFAALLPEPLLSRRGKGHFDRTFWGPHSRQFIREWDGAGVDPDLVDVEALRREWAAPVPDAGTAALIQIAWLASAGEAAD